MRRNVVLLAVIIGLVVGAVVAIVALVTPVRRFPVGAVALDADEALLLTRYNDHNETRFFMELVGADGDTRWSDDTTPVRGIEALGFTGAADAGDAVVVMGADKIGVIWVGALAKADGQPRWWISLPGAASPDGGGRIGPMLLVDGARAYVVHEVLDGVTKSDRLDALSLADGAVAWGLGKAELGAAARLDVRKVGAHLIVGTAGGHEVREVDAATGKTLRTFPVGPILCTGPDAIVAQQGDAVTLVPLASGAAPMTFELRDAGLAWSTTCGFRGDDVVVNLQRTTGWQVVRLARANGRTMFELPLGQAITAADPVVIGSALPRFVPFTTCGAAGVVPWCDIVVVDVDLGRTIEAHRIMHAPELVPMVTAERAWVWLDAPPALLAVDPSSGKLGQAIGFDAYVSRDLRADDIAAGRLWVLGATYAHPGDLPYAVVDLSSGDVVHANGALAIEDDTARVRALFVDRP